jgi:hypothetical protein
VGQLRQKFGLDPDRGVDVAGDLEQALSDAEVSAEAPPRRCSLQTRDRYQNASGAIFEGSSPLGLRLGAQRELRCGHPAVGGMDHRPQPVHAELRVNTGMDQYQAMLDRYGACPGPTR